MPDSTQQGRRLSLMDWLVIVLVGFAVTFPLLLLFSDMDYRHRMESVGTLVTASGCVLLVAWMWFGNGARSSIWRWLPPFWPWSKYLTGTVSRWCLVMLLVIGTVLGIIFSP